MNKALTATGVKKKVKRTERGWAGHFCCSSRCLFRRNTLLEYKRIKIVVSTVGLMENPLPREERFMEIGFGRHYETMAWHSKKDDKRYHDMDVNREVSFESNWAISELDADDKANDMHEKVVEEISRGLESGNKYES